MAADVVVIISDDDDDDTCLTVTPSKSLLHFDGNDADTGNVKDDVDSLLDTLAKLDLDKEDEEGITFHSSIDASQMTALKQLNVTSTLMVGNIPLRQRELNLLIRNNWLNDELINAFLEKLKPLYHRTLFLNTFFFTKLSSHGRYKYENVRRWMRKTNMWKYDCVVVPINHNNYHWSLACIDLKRSAIVHYDSMGTSRAKAVLDHLFRFLADHAKHDSARCSLDENDINGFEKITASCPQQDDGSSCGVFLCMFALHVATGSQEYQFDATDATVFRRKIAFYLFRELIADEPLLSK